MSFSPNVFWRVFELFLYFVLTVIPDILTRICYILVPIRDFCFLDSQNHKYFQWRSVVRHYKKKKIKTHWKAEAANLFKVQWHSNPHTDVGSPLHRCWGDGEVLRIVSSQKHLEHTVHPLPEKKQGKKDVSRLKNILIKEILKIKDRYVCFSKYKKEITKLLSIFLHWKNVNRSKL